MSSFSFLPIFFPLVVVRNGLFLLFSILSFLLIEPSALCPQPSTENVMDNFLFVESTDQFSVLSYFTLCSVCYCVTLLSKHFFAAFFPSALLLHVGVPNSVLGSCTLPMTDSVVHYGYIKMTLMLYPYCRSLS